MNSLSLFLSLSIKIDVGNLLWQRDSFAAFRPSIDLVRTKGGDTVHGLLGIDPQTITMAKLQSHGNNAGAKKKSRNGEYEDEDATEEGATENCGACQR